MTQPALTDEQVIERLTVALDKEGGERTGVKRRLGAMLLAADDVAKLLPRSIPNPQHWQTTTVTGLTTGIAAGQFGSAETVGGDTHVSVGAVAAGAAVATISETARLARDYPRSRGPIVRSVGATAFWSALFAWSAQMLATNPSSLVAQVWTAVSGLGVTSSIARRGAVIDAAALREYPQLGEAMKTLLGELSVVGPKVELTTESFPQLVRIAHDRPALFPHMAEAAGVRGPGFGPGATL